MEKSSDENPVVIAGQALFNKLFNPYSEEHVAETAALSERIEKFEHDHGIVPIYAHHTPPQGR